MRRVESGNARAAAAGCYWLACSTCLETMRPIRCCCCYCSGPILSATHLHPAASPVLPRPGKTRLLVTHQRQFLPGCDTLLVMRGGRIALRCTWLRPACPGIKHPASPLNPCQRRTLSFSLRGGLLVAGWRTASATAKRVTARAALLDFDFNHAHHRLLQGHVRGASGGGRA